MTDKGSGDGKLAMTQGVADEASLIKLLRCLIDFGSEILDINIDLLVGIPFV